MLRVMYFLSFILHSLLYEKEDKIVEALYWIPSLYLDRLRAQSGVIAFQVVEAVSKIRCFTQIVAAHAFLAFLASVCLFSDASSYQRRLNQEGGGSKQRIEKLHGA